MVSKQGNKPDQSQAPKKTDRHVEKLPEQTVGTSAVFHSSVKSVGSHPEKKSLLSEAERQKRKEFLRLLARSK